MKPTTFEQEIEKILDNRFYGFGGSLKERVWDYRGAIDDLTALFTHHTSEKVKERIRQFQLLYGRFNSDTGELMDYKTNEYGENPVNLLIKFLTAQAAEGEGE